MVSASLLRRGRGWALNRGRVLGDRSHRPSVAEDDNIHPFGGFHRGDLADEFQPVHDRTGWGRLHCSATPPALRPVRGFHNLFQFDARLTSERSTMLRITEESSTMSAR